MAMNPLRGWDRFWFAPVSARPLGAFRVVVGCLALVNLGFLTIDLDYWMSGVGLLQGTEAQELAGPLRLSPLQTFQSPLTIRVVLAAEAVATLLFTLGWRTRLMGILVYLGQLSLHHRNIATASGADVLLMVMLFYLMLSPCGAAYSIDAWRESRKRGTLAEPIISPWAQRLMQIQLIVMYLVSSIFKCAGTTWLTGTALHFVVCNREVGRFDIGWLAEYPAFINIATFGGLAVEFALAFLLWFKAARPWVLVAGISLHVGILFAVNIPLFGELSMATYLLFLDSSEFAAVRRALNVRGWFRQPNPARLGKAFRIDPPAVSAIPGTHHPTDVALSTSFAWRDESDEGEQARD